MHLNETEKRMLAGENGKACELAMNILSDLGDLYGAERMIAVSQVHIDMTAKYANYCFSQTGLNVLFSGTRDCVETAISGELKTFPIVNVAESDFNLLKTGIHAEIVSQKNDSYVRI
jgi:hypothetical protein